MTDETKAAEQANGTQTDPTGGNPPKPSHEEQGGWDKEKQAEMTRKMQEYSKIKDEASQYNMTASQYVDWLREQAIKLQESEKTNNSKEETSEIEWEEMPVKIKEVFKQLDMTQKELKAAKAEAIKAQQVASLGQINTMWREFAKDEKGRDEKDRFGFSKEELDKFLSDQKYGTMIGDEADKAFAKGEDANVYQIAAEILDIKKTRAEFAKRGAETREQLSKVGESTRVMKSEAPPPQKGDDTNKKMADEIAPDDAPYKMPT